MGYINRVTSWWGKGVTRDLGVPGETTSTTIDYNYLLLGYWTCQGSPQDIAQLWATIGNYGVENHELGTKYVQASLRKKYNDNGMRILVSAFGNYEFPNTGSTDGFKCGQSLANFVKENNLDGAVADWEDNGALKTGNGEEWLI